MVGREHQVMESVERVGLQVHQRGRLAAGQPLVPSGEGPGPVRVFAPDRALWRTVAAGAGLGVGVVEEGVGEIELREPPQAGGLIELGNLGDLSQGVQRMGRNPDQDPGVGPVHDQPRVLGRGLVAGTRLLHQDVRLPHERG